MLQEELDPSAQALTASTFLILAGQDSLKKQVADAALPALASLLQGCADPDGRQNALMTLNLLTADAGLYRSVADAALQQLCLVLQVGGCSHLHVSVNPGPGLASRQSCWALGQR